MLQGARVSQRAQAQASAGPRNPGGAKSDQRVGGLRPRLLRRKPFAVFLPQVREKTDAGKQAAWGSPLQGGEAPGESDHIVRKKRSAATNEPWRTDWAASGDHEGIDTYYNVVHKTLLDVCCDAAGGSKGGTQGGRRADGASRKRREHLMDFAAQA